MKHHNVIYLYQKNIDYIDASKGENNLGGNVINSSADRYKYMSIRQLQDIADELKEEAKRDPARDKEYHVAYKALQDKIRERDKNRPKCIPQRFEHELDVGEEF